LDPTVFKYLSDDEISDAESEIIKKAARNKTPKKSSNFSEVNNKIDENKQAKV
jgi:hypothetical protein